MEERFHWKMKLTRRTPEQREAAETRRLAPMMRALKTIHSAASPQTMAPEDLDAMRKSLDQLQAQLDTRDGQHLYRLDHIFHRGVAAAAHNHLLYRQCEILLDHYLRFEVKSVYNNSIDAQVVFNEHVAIYDAIAAKSPERAEQAMARHLTNSYRRTVSRYWPE